MLTFARRADTSQFDRPLFQRKAKALPETFRRRRDLFVFGLENRAALTADQKLNGMRVIWMLASDKTAGRFQTMDQAMFHQKIEATINAGGRG